MEIAVEGWRSGVADWQAVSSLPAEELPPLSNEQREVARKLGISEEDYARSVVAGERNQEVLLAKTERLARLLQAQLGASELVRVVLRTFEGRFDVELRVSGRVVPLRIEESLVDDAFDSGSVEAERNLGRVVERALAGAAQ